MKNYLISDWLFASAGPAAFIAEPLLGNAGGVTIPPGYLSGVYQAVRRAGGVCISDEVQIGYGRLGSSFWGFEQHDVIPDIISVAKAAGNGQPLGYVVTTSKVCVKMAISIIIIKRPDSMISHFRLPKHFQLRGLSSHRLAAVLSAVQLELQCWIQWSASDCRKMPSTSAAN